jgi:hypothetical protein
MHWYRLVVPATVVFAAGFLLAEQCPASPRDEVLWTKAANYNVRVPPRRNALAVVSKKKHTHVTLNVLPETVKKQRPPRILATFDYGEASLVVKPVSHTVAPPVPPPSRCEWARSVVAGFAFGNVKVHSCEGTIFTFVGSRDVRTFLIKISGIDGNLVKVEQVGSAKSEAPEHDKAGIRSGVINRN